MDSVAVSDFKANFKQVIKMAQKMPAGGDEEFLRLRVLSQFATASKTRRGFLANEFIVFLKNSHIKFEKYNSDLFIWAGEGYVVVLFRKFSGRGRYDEAVCSYGLYVSNGNGLFISESDDDREYDDHGYRRPIMELYDMVSVGQLRKIPISHVCGLMGYNPMLGDTCEACEKERKNRV